MQVPQGLILKKLPPKLLSQNLIIFPMGFCYVLVSGWALFFGFYSCGMAINMCLVQKVGLGFKGLVQSSEPMPIFSILCAKGDRQNTSFFNACKISALQKLFSLIFFFIRFTFFFFSLFFFFLLGFLYFFVLVKCIKNFFIEAATYFGQITP